jgi:DNA-binding GntR family transcriptional regulator
MSDLSALRVLQSQSLPSVVRDEITRLIVRGVYPPGAKLGEEDLAEQLGVSRGPIREAFRSLEQAGLVRVSKNRGVFVRAFTFQEAQELYVVRRGIEQLVGEILVPQITDEQIAELADMVERMDKDFVAQDFEKYFPQDRAFHDRIAQMANNSKLLEIQRSIANEMQLIRLQSMRRGGGMLFSNVEHRTIVEALKQRDAQAAIGAIGQHIVNAFERVSPLLLGPDKPSQPAALAGAG